MTEGVISGGWEFVWAAYGITAAVFVLYGISLWTRLRDVQGDVQGDVRGEARRK